MNLKSKVFVVYDKGGCSFWRTWLPMEQMRKEGLIEVRYAETKMMSSKDLSEGLKWCDVACIRGLMGMEALKTLRQYRALGVKVMTDYDDLHFNVSPFNVAYRHFGTEEVEVKDPSTGDVQFLWKDGKDGFDLKANQLKFHSYKAILQECDLVTTTTIYLKNAIVEISGREDNIRVLPNAIDFENWKPLDVRDKFDDEFRFGWAVSNSHGEDWISFRPALTKFLETHPKAKFVCIGDTSFDITRTLPKDQVEWYPFSNLWEGHYALRMAMLGLDVAIAPLADTEFNRCKSPLKYAEYTAFGWPVIAQNMEPYSSHIINGETGLLAKTTEDWLRCLDTLYNDKAFRSKLHFNAMFAVRQMFDLKEVANQWHEVIKNLISNEVVKL